MTSKMTYKMIDFKTDNSIKEIDFNKLNNAFTVNNTNSEIYPINEIHQINIQLLDNKEIIDLNKEFRGKDYLPDVLSFDYRQEKMFEHEISGEVFISLEKAKEQAKDKGHSLTEELLFLAIHGILHVLGFDHNTDEEEKIMNNFENLINKSYINLT